MKVALWVGMCLSLLAQAGTKETAVKPFVFLDSGHTPKNPGCKSVSGDDEVFYNDRLTEMVKAKLDRSGLFRTALTRAKDQEVTLAQRAKLANDAGADSFIAIHHDSANPVYLKKVVEGTRTSYQLLPILKEKFQIGYGVFVSKKNEKFADSLRAAEFLGEEVKGLGRAISTYHTEKIENEGRTFLNERWGVYQYDDLAVLKNTKMPAVLFEAAVIVDDKENAYALDDKNREALAAALERAVERYFFGKDGNLNPKSKPQ